ncbi:PBECR4 domain-containing protein [Lacrimispora sp.]|uniref:PBECR4 domain-containing protein n=1 Tax=Lacrimispora sp. TaxID=2719234 RepID=UPI00345FC746
MEEPADYLISSHLDSESFIFIIQASPNRTAKCDYLCCSVFTKGDRDYEINQRIRTILKKEQIHIKTKTSIILYDRRTHPPNTSAVDEPDNT